MNTAAVLAVAKQRIGLSTTVRDTYLTAIVDGVLAELINEQGLAIDLASPNHLMFVADLAAWRYMNRDAAGNMPRDLQYRLHNLLIHARAGAEPDV